MTPYLPNGEPNPEYWAWVEAMAKATPPDGIRYYDSEKLEREGFALQSTWDGEKWVVVGVIVKDDHAP